MKQWNRRRFLKAAGVSIGLPWLEAAPRPSPAPTRFAALFFPNGVQVEEWGGSGEGSAFQLKGLLKPLDALKSKIIVPSGLWHERLEQRGGHDGKTSGFLTGMENYRLDGNQLKVGTSIDQLIASRIGSETPLPSFCLGIKPDSMTQLDLVPIYRSYISWASPSQPAPKEIDPRFAFDRLFGSAEQRRRDKSILDAVREQAVELRASVSRPDSHKLDEFFESVRDVEKRTEAAHSESGSRWRPDPMPALERPTHRPEQREAHARLMLDLMVLAFQTNTTRVSTFMFDNGGCTGNFTFLPGVTEEWHAASHHRDRPEIKRQYEAINRWHVEQYAYLLAKMEAIQEGDGTLLDHSMVLLGSGLADGNKHTASNLPLVLAGQGNGSLRTGRAIAYAEHTPLARLFISIAQRMGVEVASFADANQQLDRLS